MTKVEAVYRVHLNSGSINEALKTEVQAEYPDLHIPRSYFHPARLHRTAATKAGRLMAKESGKVADNAIVVIGQPPEKLSGMPTKISMIREAHLATGLTGSALRNLMVQRHGARFDDKSMSSYSPTVFLEGRLHKGPLVKRIKAFVPKPHSIAPPVLDCHLSYCPNCGTYLVAFLQAAAVTNARNRMHLSDIIKGPSK